MFAALFLHWQQTPKALGRFNMFKLIDFRLELCYSN